MRFPRECYQMRQAIEYHFPGLGKGARHIFAPGTGAGFGEPVRPTGIRRQGWLAAGLRGLSVGIFGV